MLGGQERQRRKEELRRRFEPIFIASIRHAESELLMNELYLDRATVVGVIASKFADGLRESAKREGLDAELYREDMELLTEIAWEMAEAMRRESIH